MYHGNVNYNVAAMYHPKALDIFGKKDMKNLRQFFKRRRKICARTSGDRVLYTFAYSAITIVPACKPAI